MCQATDKQIIEVLKMETIPALGLYGTGCLCLSLCPM